MENNKRFKFNIIDFLIVFAIIAVAVVVLFRNGIIDSFTKKSQTIIYSVKVLDIQEESYEYFEVGSTIYSNDDNRELGKIVEKSFEPSTAYFVLSDGTVSKSVQPGRIDVNLTIEVDGTVDEEGCKIDGTYFIAAGKTISCYVDKLYFNVTVRSAEEKVLS